MSDESRVSDVVSSRAVDDPWSCAECGFDPIAFTEAVIQPISQLLEDDAYGWTARGKNVMREMFGVLRMSARCIDADARKELGGRPW